MDKGTWTFRCRECCGTFELMLSEQDRASEFAQERRCPSCGERGHQVIGYRPEKNTRPFII